MDSRLLESLLYQEESETLDFKGEQYPFDKATDNEKGELLKDLLAFANTWRQTDAYILIGVKGVRGGRSIVPGITDHLLNRNLQQFVHSKTNRPVKFSCAPFTFEGKEIDILKIPLQDYRPVYLKKTYGRVQEGVVYIRRGDTTGTASPDEVARMGASAARAQPVVQLDFADLRSRDKLGTSLQVSCKPIEIPAREAIPLYGEPRQGVLGISPSYASSFGNSTYYRELAEWHRDFAHLYPVGLAVTNPSSTVAEHVVVTLEIDNAEGLSVLDGTDMPPPPVRNWFPWVSSPMPGGHTVEVEVCLYGEKFEIRAELGSVQPGTTAWSHDEFYIGARGSRIAIAKVTISADNLRVPVTLTAEIVIEATPQRLDVQDIINLAATEQSD